jgi:hypothetical protein
MTVYHFARVRPNVSGSAEAPDDEKGGEACEDSDSA